MEAGLSAKRATYLICTLVVGGWKAEAWNCSHTIQDWAGGKADRLIQRHWNAKFRMILRPRASVCDGFTDGKRAALAMVTTDRIRLR